MKKQIIGLGLAATLALAASPSFATGKKHHTINLKEKICHFLPLLCKKPKHNKPGNPQNPGTPTHSVPEIDAANAGLALALIGGLVAIRRERRNRK